MNEQWLSIFLILIVLLTLPLILYPFRHSKKLCIFLIPVVCIAVFFAYKYWGSQSEWQAYKQKQRQQRQVQDFLQTIKTPGELVERLKKRLKLNPNNAQGWFLLGRLYASQNQWPEASQSFAKAYGLKPQDEAISVNYAQSLWQINEQSFTEKIRTILGVVLEANPKQADALAMLAMDAFINQNYQKAINYWQRLVIMVPPSSEEAKMIAKAIANARKKLKKLENE